VNSWEMFERALLRSGSERIELLNDAETALGWPTEASDIEVDVLRASIASVLAGDGQVAPESARDLVVSVSSRQGSSGWPGFYLAEAGNQLGRNDIVLDAVSSVSPGFFEARDLKWRSARCDELRAVALIRSGAEWKTVVEVVTRLVSAFANFGESDDFAPPSDLVHALLEGPPEAIELLNQLALSIDLDLWFGAEIAARVEEVLGRRMESGD